MQIEPWRRLQATAFTDRLNNLQPKDNTGWGAEMTPQSRTFDAHKTESTRDDTKMNWHGEKLMTLALMNAAPHPV